MALDNAERRGDLPFQPGSFVVASFMRGGHDNYARVLENHGLLSFYALGTRRGTQGVSPQHTRLKPVFGLLNYLAAKCLPPFQSESFRFALYPMFDRWVRSQLRPGQHLITSFGFANAAMRWVKQNGGWTAIDAGNSHPRYFWKLLTEEHARWNSPYPPVSKSYNLRAAETADLADYVFAESAFVHDSFLEEGKEPGRVFRCMLPVNIDWFKPASESRPASRPLTLLNTGALCLRKGTPYLLEAFRLIREKEPAAVLRLTQNVRDDAKEILRRYADLPIDWAPGFDLSREDERRKYVERFQTSDVFIFPTLEEGFVRVLAEAMACGVPVIATKNAGSSDLIEPGVNGEVVPIRDPRAMADATLKWWADIRAGKRVRNIERIRDILDFATFEKTVMRNLLAIGESR